MIIDIHSHILPCRGDDGSNSMQNTISLVLAAHSQGVRTIFATPHSEAFYRGNILLYFDIMKRMLKSILPDMEFYLGSEIMCMTMDMADIITALESGRLATMNGSRYVLVEFEEEVFIDTVNFCIELLQENHWKPILAHWERYVNLRNNLDYVGRLRSRGCLVQVNLYDLEETNDNQCIRDWARMLIDERLVDFLGTDCHSTFFRPPSVTEGMLWLQKNCRSEEYLEKIVWKNASDLLIQKSKDGESEC